MNHLRYLHQDAYVRAKATAEAKGDDQSQIDALFELAYTDQVSDAIMLVAAVDARPLGWAATPMARFFVDLFDVVNVLRALFSTVSKGAHEGLTHSAVMKRAVDFWTGQLRPAVAEFLAKCGNGISITTDIWTSVNLDAFISVTAHAVDPSVMELRNTVLAMKHFPGLLVAMYCCSIRFQVIILSNRLRLFFEMF